MLEVFVAVFFSVVVLFEKGKATLDCICVLPVVVPLHLHVKFYIRTTCSRVYGMS